MVLSLNNLLKESIENDFHGFSVKYQPIIKIENKHRVIYGSEALLRWESELYTGNTSPDILIPILEADGLINDVGKYVIDCGFKQCAVWREFAPNFIMNINVSAKQLNNYFTPYVLDSLSKYNLDPSAITLELTESTSLEYKTINDCFKTLRAHGVHIALDDFGTGFASFDIFRSINIDKLKIDRSFIKEITVNATDQVIIRQIAEMCKTLKIGICIEGIETVEMESTLSVMGEFLYQGFLYDKPIPAELFTSKYIQTHKAVTLHSNKRTVSHHRYSRALSPIDIMNRLSIGILQVKIDEDFTILATNKGFRYMLSYSESDLITKFQNKGIKMIHPEDLEWVLSELERQLKHDEDLILEYRLLNNENDYTWVMGMGNVIEHEDGIKTMVFVTHNIEKHSFSRRLNITKQKIKNH